MNEQPQGQPPRQDDPGKLVGIVVGAALVFIGVTMLARGIFWPGLDFARMWNIVRGAGWGLGLIILGIIAIIWTQRPGFKAPPKGTRLYRSRTDRVVGGVLGGVATYLGMDATLVRLAYVGLSLMFGVWPAFVAYIAALIIVPEAPLGVPPGQSGTAWPPQPPAPPTPQPPAPPAPPAPPGPE